MGGTARLDTAGSKSLSPLPGEKEMVCRGCGGRTTFTGALTCARCPYCVTPIRLEDVHEASGWSPVDGVVPFQVDPMVAKETVERWLRARRFVPGRFKRYCHTGSLASVYASCFSYDGDASTAYRGRRGDECTVAVGTGGTRRHEHRVRWRDVSGAVQSTFADVCVLANDGFDDQKVRALEPWPTHLAKPFSEEYVAGHLCRRQDHDVDECFVEAGFKVDDDIDGAIRRDIGGDHQEVLAKHTSFSSLTSRHLLMPIWLFTVTFEKHPFQVFIDGVTGELHGRPPRSRPKLVAAGAAGAAGAAVIACISWPGGGS